MATSRFRRRLRIGLVVFWSSVAAWQLANMQAWGVENAVLESDARVRVSTTASGRTFTPTPDTAAVGLVFYPGALVDPTAYAPLARAVAEAGYPVAVLDLPFRLAPLDRQQAALTRRTLGVVRGGPPRGWVVGGHSRGGALAARFARDHAPDLAGLLLVGTSHPREDDLSALALDVTKVYGTEDGLASEAEVEQFAPNLPPSTHWARVDGGNHAHFGWYGWQLGDGRARIPRAEQHAATVRAVLGQLRRIEAAHPAAARAPARGGP